MTDALAICDGASAIGIDVSPEHGERLAAFATLLRRWSGAYNLVSREDLGRFESRHLLDSLAFAPYLRGQRVADLGTGAGLPGIPLAIVRPDIEFALLDRSDKRLRFVRHAILELALTNVTEVLTVDVAHFRPATGFDTVVARALADPAVVWRVAPPLLRARGRIVCGTALGVLAPVAEAIVAAVHPVAIPGVERRHQLIVVDFAETRTDRPERK